MLIVGLFLLIVAASTAAYASGAVVLPTSGIQKRARSLMLQSESSEGRWARLRADVSADGLLAKLTSPTMLHRIERNIVLAGRPDTWTVRRVIVAKPLGLATGIFFAAVILGRTNSVPMMLFAFALVALGYFLPDLLIYNQAVKRQEVIQKSLPDMLDQIVISIEAGVGFEQSLMKVAEGGEGPLADEIVRLTQDITLGMSRRDAYLALADRTSVDELKGFAKAVVQAEEYGVSIASVVRGQAKEMRLSRRMRAEAKAQQVPVKILFPLMSLILPVLFIVVLGPSIVAAYSRS